MSDEQSIFLRALELSSAEERQRYLDEACGDDSTLRSRIEELIARHAEDSGFLEQRSDDSPTTEVFDAQAHGNDPSTRETFIGGSVNDRSPTDSLRPGMTVRYIGDYEILEEVARGGMGVVYKARQVRLKRIVALKMILSGEFASEADVRRFHTEAESAAQLDHPHIVPVYEVGEHQGIHYFSMGYVDGHPMSARIAAAPYSPREAAAILKALAEAVAYAHQRGVIHRDLKPGNVLMDRTGQPRITDFGLAKQTTGNSSLTGTGTILGTPSYMPPEQATGRADLVHEPADVYSLGAILYAALTGRPPFQADNPLETLRQVVQQEPVSPRQLNPHIPRDLETICLKCLEKQIHRRYATARELADELDRFLSGKPILARPVGVTERAWKWCRRNRLVAGLLATVAASLVIGTVVSTYFAIEADRRADENLKLATSNRELADAEAKAKRAAFLQAANSTLDKSLALSEAGEVHEGLLWMADALDSASRAEAHPVAEACRYNLAFWSARSPQLEMSSGTESVYGLAIDPAGQRVAMCEWGRTTIYDVQTGRQIGPHLEQKDYVNACAFSPDGGTLYTGGQDGKICWWNTATGQPLREPIIHGGEKMKLNVTPRRAGVRSLSLHVSGKLLATAAANNVILWNTETGEAVGDKIERAAYVTVVGFEGDGKHFWVGAEDHTLQCYETESRKPVGEVCRYGYPICLAAWPDRPRMLVGFRSSKGIAVLERSGMIGEPLPNTDDVHSVAIHPNGKWICAVDQYRRGRIWNLEQRVKLGGEFRAFGVARAVQFLPQGQHVIVGTSGRRRFDAEFPTRGSLQRWRLPEPAFVRNYPGPLPMAISRDAKHVAGYNATEYKLWSRDSGEAIDAARPAFTADLTNLFNLAFDAEGRLVAGSYYGVFQRWNPLAPAAGIELLTKQTGGYRALSFDGTIVVNTGHKPNSAYVWRLDPPKQILTLKQEDLRGGLTKCLAVSRDNRLIAIGASTGAVRVWEIGTGKPLTEIETLAQTEEPTSIVFSADGTSLLIGLTDGSSHWLRWSDGAILGSTPTQSTPLVAALLTDDEQFILTGTRDGRVRVWHAPTGRPLGPILPHGAALYGLQTTALPDLFFSTGTAILPGGGGQNEGRTWRLHRPWPGTPEEIRRRVEIVTTLQITPERSVGALYQSEMLERIRAASGDEAGFTVGDVWK